MKLLVAIASTVSYQLLVHQWICCVLCYPHNSIGEKISLQALKAIVSGHRCDYLRYASCICHTSTIPIGESLDCTIQEPINGLVRRYEAASAGSPVNKELCKIP